MGWPQWQNALKYFCGKSKWKWRHISGVYFAGSQFLSDFSEAFEGSNLGRSMLNSTPFPKKLLKSPNLLPNYHCIESKVGKNLMVYSVTITFGHDEIISTVVLIWHDEDVFAVVVHEHDFLDVFKFESESLRIPNSQIRFQIRIQTTPQKITWNQLILVFYITS